MYAECGAAICFNDINQKLADKGLAAYGKKGVQAHGYVYMDMGFSHQSLGERSGSIYARFFGRFPTVCSASLFITAGGVNSLHEALYFGVPCLVYPQQGEQRLNARRFEKLDFGRILRNPKSLRQEAQRCMELKGRWDEKRRKQMTAVSLGKVLELFEICGAEADSK